MGNYLGYDGVETLDCVQRENDVLAADRSVDDVWTLVRTLEEYVQPGRHTQHSDTPQDED